MTIFVSSSTPLVPTSTWYDEVLPLVSGITPGKLVDNAIMRGAIELCTQSKAWEVELPAINISALVNTYPFNPGIGVRVVQPLTVLVNGAAIDPQSPTYFDSNIPDWRHTPSDGVKGYYCPDEDNIRIVPTPSSSIAGALVMTVAVKPSETADGILARFWNHLEYRDAITNAALSYLYGINNMPWTDLQESEKRRLLFSGAVGRFDALRSKGRSRMPMRSNVIHGVR